MARRPQRGAERCLYDTYAENLTKIINEASILIDETNINEFRPVGKKISNSAPQERGPILRVPADEKA
jgi:hypothetical protein